MAAPQNFRSAFNGFNREDVVRYLEYINAKHASEINQLNSEADFLRSRLEGQLSAEDFAALEEERDSLRAQLEEMKERCEALEEALANQAPAQPESVSPAEELEAYRRAERTERMARERAEQMYRQANAILADATVKVDDAATLICQMSDKVSCELAELQTAVAGSKQALRDAAATMYTICPTTDMD